LGQREQRSYSASAPSLRAAALRMLSARRVSRARLAGGRHGVRGAADLTPTSVTAAVPPASVAAPSLPATTIALGSELSADVGSWESVVPLAFSFQWQACAPAPSAGGCTDISNATSPSYTPLWLDLRNGAELRLEVSAWSIAGPSTVDSAESTVEGISSAVWS
jgi:hypothetical protein